MVQGGAEVHKEYKASQGTQAHQARKESKDYLEPRGQQARGALLGSMDRRGPREHKGQREYKGLRDHKEYKGQRDHRAYRV